MSESGAHDTAGIIAMIDGLWQIAVAAGTLIGGGLAGFALGLTRLGKRQAPEERAAVDGPPRPALEPARQGAGEFDFAAKMALVDQHTRQIEEIKTDVREIGRKIEALATRDDIATLRDELRELRQTLYSSILRTPS